MRKKINFQYLTIAMALIFTAPMYSMNKKRCNALVTSIKTKIDTLKNAQTKNSDIEEVNSPEIQKEQQQIITSVIHDAQQLDMTISVLPGHEQAAWRDKQIEILEPAKNSLKQAIAETVTATWQQKGKAIVQASFDIVIAGVATAAIGLVTQGIKVGTGNLLTLDTDTLMATALTSTAYAAVTALSKRTGLASISSGALSEALITPCFTNNSLTIIMPSISGPIVNWAKIEAMLIATKIIEDNGGISKMLTTIDIHRTFFPSWNKQIGTPSHQLVLAALPHVQTIIKNQKIASVLTEVGWIVMQSAAVGGLLYMTGLGYANTTMTQSVGYAVLTGVAQGTLAAVATIGGKLSPGSLITIASAPLAQQAFAIAGGTPQAAATAVVQATVTEVSTIFMNESTKYGGLLPSLQRGKDLLGQAMRSRWSSTWSTIVDAWETIQEIEPLSI